MMSSLIGESDKNLLREEVEPLQRVSFPGFKSIVHVHHLQSNNIDIKCDKNGDLEQFTAVVTLPTGFGTVPVFNEASNVNPSVSDDCVIKQTVVGSNKFSVKINDFEACGVQTQKASDGANWMSVSLRFPMIGSLRTAEDEV